MASDVDICNLALSHFGQAADITVLDEGSTESDLCQRFYPVALNELLEEFDWSFARTRGTLAELTNDREDWAYKYQRPADCLKERRLLPDGYSDETTEITTWQREGDNVYTNDELSVLVYTRFLTDTTKFSPLFAVALSWRVSAYIAGPITKDPTGQTALRLRNISDGMAERAKTSDANMDRNRATYRSTAERAR